MAKIIADDSSLENERENIIIEKPEKSKNNNNNIGLFVSSELCLLRESEMRSQNEVKLKDRLEKFTPDKRRKVAQK